MALGYLETSEVAADENAGASPLLLKAHCLAEAPIHNLVPKDRRAKVAKEGKLEDGSEIGIPIGCAVTGEPEPD